MFGLGVDALLPRRPGTTSSRLKEGGINDGDEGIADGRARGAVRTWVTDRFGRWGRFFRYVQGVASLSGGEF